MAVVVLAARLAAGVAGKTHRLPHVLPRTRTAGADAGATPATTRLISSRTKRGRWCASLAEDLDDEQMDDEGVSAGSGAAERMTLQLTEAERVELARLLQEQLRLAGVSESVS